MPLPIFPTEEGVPGDGSLVAIYGGGSTEVVGGIIHYAQVVEVHPQTNVGFPAASLHCGDPLLANGFTIWLQGSLCLDVWGTPVVTDYADMMSRWDTVRAKLLLANYELFLYYHPASPTTYRKLKTVNTAYLRGTWNDPTCFSYLLAAVTADKTLYTTAPGS